MGVATTYGRTGRRWGRAGARRWSVGLLVSATVLLTAAGPALAATPGTRSAASAPFPAFDAPSAIAAAGADLFVANAADSTVTEIAAASGSLVATISAKRFGLDHPTAEAVVGADLFVANGRGDSVSEIKMASRHHIRTIKGTRYGFSDPVALASAGADLFVLNGTGSVTEMATSNGALVGRAAGAAYHFDRPTGIGVADGLVFVVNSASNSVTVLRAATRAVVATLSGPSFAFSSPIGVTFDGAHVWVTNQADESVTELSPVTLQALNVVVSGNLPMVGPIAYGDGYVFTVSPPGSSPMVSQIVPSSADVTWMMCNTNGPYLFNDPQSLAVDGENLWVANEGGNSLTEMDADSGALIRTVF